MQDKCFKTRRCLFYEQGRCDRGDSCAFAHSDVELRDVPDLKKTKLCTVWKKGHCRAGSKCNYAHGNEDLRMSSIEDYDTAPALSPTPIPGYPAEDWDDSVVTSPYSPVSSVRSLPATPEGRLHSFLEQMASPITLDYPGAGVDDYVCPSRPLSRLVGPSRSEDFAAQVDPFFEHRSRSCTEMQDAERRFLLDLESALTPVQSDSPFDHGFIMETPIHCAPTPLAGAAPLDTLAFGLQGHNIHYAPFLGDLPHFQLNWDAGAE